MAALDRFHQVVVNALMSDGWTITANPLSLTIDERTLQIDLAAERLLGATKGKHKIAVEVKTFGGPSPVADLQAAIGQYAMYEDALDEVEPDRRLYLAIPKAAYDTIFSERLGRIALKKRLSHVLVYDIETEEILQWIPEP